MDDVYVIYVCLCGVPHSARASALEAPRKAMSARSHRAAPAKTIQDLESSEQEARKARSHEPGDRELGFVWFCIICRSHDQDFVQKT